MAIHVPCTSKKLGVTGAFEQVAALCAKEVTPSGVPCCGEWSCSPETDLSDCREFLPI